MKVSLNIVKQYIDFDLPPVEELVARINAQLGGVEEVIDLTSKYKDAKIVKVVDCEKHPNADKLSVCMVDAGEGELVQIVCGANNVHADMWAVWLPPKSTVPATFNDAEPFVLGARELRGVMSNGMLASARELAIGDDHDGIVDIKDADVPAGKELKPGASFAEIFGLDDTIIDIENKMFTHRPDLFGQLGVAREISGIFGHKFTSPEWYKNMPEFSTADTLPLEVFNDASDKAPRLMAVVIEEVRVEQSPLWLKCALVAMGGKPINNIVDITNYIMLLTAQPTHAYDYDKIKGQKLGVRLAKSGEKLQLLNGKTYELSDEDIVIADAEGAIGLAGIMGGGNSEVSADTKNIVLEVANFDMYAVRKSSMRHGLFTDALTRFNKGQSPLQNPVVMARLISMVGGRQGSPVFDLNNAILPDEVTVTSTFINQRLGIGADNSHIQKLLSNVEIEVDSPDDHDTYISVWPPFWRTDLLLPEDIVEEVGRLYGFDKLPRELPKRSTKPVPVKQGRALARTIRDVLSRAGANEVLTYSFVPERVLVASGQTANDAYRLSNALSPDLQYYRLSLTPSLLDKVHANSKAGYDEFALFEIGMGHSKSAGVNEEGLPIEANYVSLVYANKTSSPGAPFYRAKTFAQFLMDQLGIAVSYEQLGGDSTAAHVAPFETKRSAIILDQTTGLYLGVVGEYKKTVQRNFKLPEYTAGFELNMESLLKAASQSGVRYRPLSRFPSVERDVSLKVADGVAFSDLRSAVVSAFGREDIDVAIFPVGIYQPDGSLTKNTTFHVVLTSQEKTLTSAEVNSIFDAAAVTLKQNIDAEVV